MQRELMLMAALVAGGFIFGMGAVSASDAGARIDVMDNGILEVRYAEANNSMKVTDLRNGRVYTQSGYPSEEVGAVKVAGNELILGTKVKGFQAKVTITMPESSPTEVKVKLSAPAGTKMSSNLAFPNRFESKPGEFLLIPRGEGQLWPVEDKSFGGWWHVDLAFAGALDIRTGSGYQMIYDTPFDIQTDVSAYKGLMTLAPQWQPSKGTFGYDRVMAYRFYDKGGYVSMAKDYKARTKPLGYQIPFAEKLRTRPNLAKLKGAVDFWPMSGDVMSPDFLRNLKLLGVKRALVSLGTGWQGPQGIGDTINFVNSKGYLTSRYDIYTDIWNSADNPPDWARTAGYPQDIIRGPKGEMQKGWVIKEGGTNYQGYYACSTTHSAEAKVRVGEDLKGNPYNSRFIDVVTASSLYECYDAAHPTTREEDAMARAGLLTLMSRDFKLVTGSEQSREWAMGVTDFGEGTMSVRSTDNAGYDWMTPEKSTAPYAKENSDGSLRIPLVSLVYHEGHMSTWYTGDGYQKVPEGWGGKELLNILYGSMPLWMFDGNLWQERKADFIRSYQNVNTTFEDVAFDGLVNHSFLTEDRKVQSTEFSSGTRVFANFGDVPWTVSPESVGSAPFGFPALKGKTLTLGKEGFLSIGNGIFGFRGSVDGKPLNAVRAKDRIYLDPGDAYTDLGPVASDRMLVLHCDDDLARTKSAYLAVYGGDAGGKAMVKIRPSQLGEGWIKGISGVFVLGSDGNPVTKAKFTMTGDALEVSVDTEPGEFTLLAVKATK